MAEIKRWARQHAALSTATAVLSVFLCLLVCMMFSGQWPWRSNPFNSYTLQACAWLDGRLDLGQNYPHLELAIFNDKYYVSFPPFPSYVLLPFVVFFGAETPDGWISLFFTLMGVIYGMRLYRQVTGSIKNGVFWVTFLYLNTGYLYIGVFPFVWFLAQTICFTLSLAALYYSTVGKGGLSLTAWACAVGCRPMVAFYLPLLAWNLWTHWKKEQPGKRFSRFVISKLHWAIPACIIAFSYMILNYLRFGNPLQFGHDYLPEFTQLETGQFNLAYVANNLRSLIRLPEVADGRLNFQTLEGFAFYICNPFLVFVILLWGYSLVRRLLARISPMKLPFSNDLPAGYGLLLLGILPVLVAGHVLLLTMHHTMGGLQWGNRYLLDFLPYLLFATMMLKPKQDDRLVSILTPIYLYGAVLSVAGTIYIACV